MNYLNNAHFWYRFSFLLVIVSIDEFAFACDCPGIEVAISGHNFCFEIQRSSNASWADADQKCLSLGGFLAHLDSSSLVNSLKPYVQSNYQRPLLTGGLLGNAEYQLIALMCPNNTFMSLLNTTIASNILNGNASSASGSCLFLQNSDYKLHYDNCNSTFDILCQIPMDDTQTCGVMMQCKSNSTNSTVSTAISQAASSNNNPQTSNPAPSNNNPQASNPASSNPASLNSNPQASNAASSNPASSNNNPQASNPASSNPASLNSNPQASNSASSNSNPQASNQQMSLSTMNPINNPLNLNSNQTSKSSSSSPVSNNAFASNNDASPSSAVQDFNPSMNDPTQNQQENSSTFNPAVSMLLSSIAPNASSGSTWKQPSNSTGTSTLNGSTVPWSTDSTDDSIECESGYTKLGNWCLPWWAWLVFGLLLFLVCFTLAICLVCICIGNRKKKVSTAENYERLNTDYANKQIRPSSEPPRSIYDNNNDYLAPSPYSAPNNNSPIYI